MTMKFAFSDEQRHFAASVHDLLSAADTPTVIRAWGDGKHEPGFSLWRSLGQLGLPALLVPDRFDGLGATAVDAVVAFEMLGYHGVPGPIVESAVVAPVLLGCVTTDSVADQWLPGIAAGEAFATVLAPPHVPLALDADIAALTLAMRGGAIEELTGTRCELVRSVDRARRMFEVHGESVRLGGSESDVSRAFDLGVLAVAAQLLGAGRRLLDNTTSYAKQRSQYGKPIGQFQAIKHLLADVVTKLELAKPLLYGAAVAIDSTAVTTSRDVSAAKAAAGDAANLAARTALQVHGAIGYTGEHELGLWLTKVRALMGAWGGGSFHRRRVLHELKGAK